MSFLNNIIEYKKIEVSREKTDFNQSFSELEKACQKPPPVKSFINSLKDCSEHNEIALIAEVKKASPSKGIIREVFDPVAIAIAYEKAGAKAISVLTDEKFFQGSIQYLKDIKKVVKLPVLRKDFIIDPFQIYQTRLIGADIILLIASVLEFSKLKEYYNLSKKIGLEVLIEVHTKEELDSVLKLDAKIIGINNRNLETFKVSIVNTINLIQNKNIFDKFIISESGINNYSDVVILKNAGVSGILVGESLIRQDNTEKAVLDILGKSC
ncbi:MAG: indole-3-glycerol phosphate synthase TrpC [bacterium]